MGHPNTREGVPPSGAMPMHPGLLPTPNSEDQPVNPIGQRGPARR